jgi:Fe2+ transport system protein FeoA
VVVVGKQEICLSELADGAEGEIVRIRGNSPLKKRLLEMGLIKGEVIKKIKVAPLADPAEYVVKGYHVSLRSDEAQDVILTVIESDGM